MARSFRTSWDKVYHSVQYVVDYGLTHRRLDRVTALGVDEIQYRKGHHYLTLLYQIDPHRRRLLWMGEKRTKKALNDGFSELEQEHRRKQEAAGVQEPTRFLDQITVICSDIWKAYLTVISKRLPTAVHILDRFHIMQHFSKALDKVRAEEARRLKEQGQDPVLSKSRWCFLKRQENLSDSQGLKLSELLKMNLRTVRAYLLKEDFQRFWDYTYPANRMRSNIGTFRSNFQNWCHPYSSDQGTPNRFIPSAWRFRSPTKSLSISLSLFACLAAEYSCLKNSLHTFCLMAGQDS